MIEQVLADLGFKNEEAQTYLALYKHGTCTGGELSKITGIARATIYGYLDRLVSGGLATQSVDKTVKNFTAEPGDKIKTLYDRKIDSLRAQKNTRFPAS